MGYLAGSAAAICGVAGVVSLNAGKRAQVLVDRAKVIIGQIFQSGPGHDLKQVAIERRGDAACVRRTCTGRMEMVGIDAGANDLNEMIEGIAAYGEPGRVRSEVARDDVR